uniref:Putative secreted protein n=1 Tax=Ixodes ricinus TaxID=34613 RepID=A0A6B0TWH2_IXORI
MRSACPLCTGFLSWNANTASAPNLEKTFLSSRGVNRYSSRPSFHRIRSNTSRSPPTSQSPLSLIILM